MTNELTAERLRELVARATPGLRQSHSKHGHLREQRCTLIADVNGVIETDAALIVALVNAAPQFIALIEREARMREALVQISEIDTFTEPMSVQIARAALQPKETDDA